MSLRLSASYYRAALLLGLVRGDVVHAWAEAQIAREDAPTSALLDLSLVAPSDLSELRYALWPLCIEPEPVEVVNAILALIHADMASGRRSLFDTVTVLRQLRSMVTLSPDLHAIIGEHVNAHMLAMAGGRRSREDVESELAEWLQQFGAYSSQHE